MQHEKDRSDPEPHVFDQTNGVIDPGEQAASEDAERERLRNRTIGGIAMLSANRPAG